MLVHVDWAQTCVLIRHNSRAERSRCSRLARRCSGRAPPAGRAGCARPPSVPASRRAPRAAPPSRPFKPRSLPGLAMTLFQTRRRGRCSSTSRGMPRASAPTSARGRRRQDTGRAADSNTASSDCRDLTQALVLAVALAVDPLAHHARRDFVPSRRATPVPPRFRPAPAPPPVTAPVTPSGWPERESASAWAARCGCWVVPQLCAGIDCRARGPLGPLLDSGSMARATPLPASLGSRARSRCRWSRRSCPVLPTSVCLGSARVLAAGAELGHGQGIREASSQSLPYLGGECASWPTCTSPARSR